MTGVRKNLEEGGAKERDAHGNPAKDNPALQKENRQGAENQSSVKPEQYPDRDQTPV